jgi:uncharacterized protein YecE (DUF72 family)
MAGYFVGTSGWSYDPWKGNFFPCSLLSVSNFNRYASQFSALESSLTLFHGFTDTICFKWRRQAGPDFRYALKIPPAITHQRLIANIESEIGAFWSSVCLLGDRLGAVLLQVSPNQPMDLGWLRAVLQAFGDPTRVAVELRTPTWQNEDVRRQLEAVGAACVNVDSPHNRLNEWVTGRRAYIRLHGRRRWYADSYSDEELVAICQQANRMAAHGAEEIYIFFNNDIGGDAASNALALRQMLE